MGVSNWSPNPDENGAADPNIPAVDGAAARNIMPFFREIMAAVAQLSSTLPSLEHKAAPDADYQVLTTDTQIGFAILTAPRTVTLPDADVFPLGQVLFIADESGQCSVDRAITITVGPGTNDTIAGEPSIQITDRYQGIGLRRGTGNLWLLTEASSSNAIIPVSGAF